MSDLRRIATKLSAGIAELGPYHLVSDGSELPVFAFALDPSITNYSVFDVSAKLRERGWLIPAYTFPENRQDLSVLRVVVRSGMQEEMADTLLEHMAEQTRWFGSLDGPMPRPGGQEPPQAFKH